jgi:hypothetical protein
LLCLLILYSSAKARGPDVYVENEVDNSSKVRHEAKGSVIQERLTMHTLTDPHQSLLPTPRHLPKCDEIYNNPHPTIMSILDECYLGGPLGACVYSKKTNDHLGYCVACKKGTAQQSDEGASVDDIRLYGNSIDRRHASHNARPYVYRPDWKIPGRRYRLNKYTSKAVAADIASSDDTAAATSTSS